jgi:hypothetical protein
MAPYAPSISLCKSKSSVIILIGKIYQGNLLRAPQCGPMC